MNGDTNEDLAAQLDALPTDVTDNLRRFGFDRARFLDRAASVSTVGRADNRVTGRVEAPDPDDIVDLPPAGSPERDRIERLGSATLAGGKSALVVLAGGMATRMGGVVKALVEAVPGRTFLDLRLEGQRVLEERFGTTIPLWLMTSHSTDDPIRRALGDRLDGYRIATFPQFVSLRLTETGRLVTDGVGRPHEHSPGHGDLPEALQASGLLHRFIERGGQHVTTANLDNLGATLDPAIIGLHVESAKAVTCEVVDKVGSDRGGIPVRLDGRPLVLEEFRLPVSFDPTDVRVFNTNTFHFDAATLRDLEMAWTYFAVEKEVDGHRVIQFERLVNEVTSLLDTNYLRVSRSGAESRFLPIKDDDQLAARRTELEAVARARGMMG